MIRSDRHPSEREISPRAGSVRATMRPMRIALVSPYSWTYPGGVTRHIEALAESFIAVGHEVRVLAPVDPVDRRASSMHRDARPQPVQLPDYLVSPGRPVGFRANGAGS